MIFSVAVTIYILLTSITILSCIDGEPRPNKIYSISLLLLGFGIVNYLIL